MYDADANVISEYVEELLNEFCTLGRNGVVAVWEPDVTAEEKEGLKKSEASLKETFKLVEA